MNSYEKRLANKRARYEELAEKVRVESESRYNNARDKASLIPYGQPVMADHYSANRDRKFRASINEEYGRAFALQDKAEYYDNKASKVGTGGISSDDPEAIQKLKNQLITLQSNQDRMKKVNAIIRKHKSDKTAQIAALLLAYDFLTEEKAKEILEPDNRGRIGYESFELTNNNANIRRIEKRIKELEQKQERTEVEITTDNYVYREDISDNRIMFIFDGKPDEQKRNILKKHAFKWSPTRGAWVRQITNAALYSAKVVRNQLDSL